MAPVSVLIARNPLDEVDLRGRVSLYRGGYVSISETDDEEDDFLNDGNENFIMLTTRKLTREKVFETGSEM